MAALATACCTNYHCSLRKHEALDGDCAQQPCTSSSSSSSPGSREHWDQRQTRQKVLLFLKDAEKNRIQIERLEKDKQLSVQCRKQGWTDVSGELEEYEKVLGNERNTEKMHLQKQLVKIENSVRKFMKQLKDVKPTPTSIERLKEIMSEVETLINTLKEEQCTLFEELLKDERSCAQEVAAYDKKIENWSVSTKSEPKPRAASTVQPKPLNRDLPAEVKELESFLQKTGGSDGGWDQFDHQAFLKVWTKHSGQPAYRKEAKLYLPGKTLEEIEQHEDWHRQLISLQNGKREAIQRWKASKQLKRQSRVKGQEEVEEGEQTQNGDKRSRAQQQKAEEKRMVSQQLEEWRQVKRSKEEQEEEQKRQAEELRRSRQEKEERYRQLEVKLSVEEHLRLKKGEEDEQKRRKKEEEERVMDERRRSAATGIKHLRKRDLQRVQAMLQEKEEGERLERITAKFKEKMDGPVSSDSSRLSRPTKGWEERMKNIGASGGGPVLQMFHRAVLVGEKVCDEQCQKPTEHSL